MIGWLAKVKPMWKCAQCIWMYYEVLIKYEPFIRMLMIHAENELKLKEYTPSHL